MNEKIKSAIEEYQCLGCVSGSDISCYEKKLHFGVSCERHVAGTLMTGAGKLLLGMPKGFNRFGQQKNLELLIFETFEDFCKDWGNYDKFNIPVWMYKDKFGHTIVKGLKCRLSEVFIHIILEDCVDKINAYQLTADDIERMD